MELPYKITIAKNLQTGDYDSIIYIAESKLISSAPEPIQIALTKAFKINKNADKEGGVYEVNLPAGRLVFEPVVISKDYGDVRSFSEASKLAILRAVKAGSKNPLFILPSDKVYKYSKLVALLGVLEGLYVNLQYREDRPEVCPKVSQLGVYDSSDTNLSEIIKFATILEKGRWAARDIGGSDPERMSPPNVEIYVKQLFSNTNISVDVISDVKIFEKEYPLFEAVNRAASVIDRHAGRIITLTYEGKAVEKTLFLVGKGVTYDTGGADVKTDGHMLSMSRDKCGAAAVAGFFEVLSLLKPDGIKAVGILAMVRNSIGENSYVSDEYIMSRAGKRVRVSNTDAEGRMIMADTLCYAKEQAIKAVNPHLMTIATLTGHACLASGSYTIAMDNGPARCIGNAGSLFGNGEQVGDLVEVSYLRREDIAAHKGKVEGEDIVQSASEPSTRTPRGHQTPAGFLILSSGLDKHELDSELPLKYTHIDIAASSGVHPENATGAPITALVATYLNKYLSNLTN